VCGELIGNARPMPRRYQQIAAGDVDFVAERQRDGIAGFGFLRIATTTWSPGRTRPLATVPQIPRKSEFGRLTHCTGKRNGLSAAGDAISIDSRQCISVGPRYHGMAGLATVTLSP
jgi:hypothetical protein